MDFRSGKNRKERAMMMTTGRKFSYLYSERTEALRKDQGLVLAYSFKISGNRKCVGIVELTDYCF